MSRVVEPADVPLSLVVAPRLETPSVAADLLVTASGVVATYSVEAEAVVLLPPVVADTVDKSVLIGVVDIDVLLTVVVTPASVGKLLLVISSGVLVSDTVVPEAAETLAAVVAVSVCEVSDVEVSLLVVAKAAVLAESCVVRDLLVIASGVVTTDCAVAEAVVTFAAVVAA